jgi:hypothetical protein
METTFSIAIKTMLVAENMLYLHPNRFQNMIKEIIRKISLFNLFRVIIGRSGNNLWITVMLWRITI